MFRIALLLDSVAVSHSVKDLFEWANSQPDIEVCALILHPAPLSTTKGFAKLLKLARTEGPYAAISRTVFAAVRKVETKLLSRSPIARERLGAYKLDHHTVIRTTPQVSPSGFVFRFTEDDLAPIRALNADLLIRCGSGILKGGILNAAKHGILSLHHGDNRDNRGGPAGFWEVRERRPITGFIVQLLTEELDGGHILFRGSVSTAPTYVANVMNLSDRADVYRKKIIRRVLEGNVSPEAPLIYSSGLYRTPMLADTIAYLAQVAGYFGAKVLRRALRRRWRWGVAYTFGNWRDAVLWRGKTVPAPPGHFLADPFAVQHNGHHYIFLEDFIYAKNKGVISAYRISKTGAERLGVVLEEDFHLSFPYTFRFNGDFYMVPESASDRNVRLYRSVDFPMRWEFVGHLLPGVAAVDAMVFEHGHKWWMLATINSTAVGANDAELHLFAPETPDNPLSPWRPCGDNPLFVDAMKGRNGGILRDGDELYRVAQKPGFCEYGKASTIYRIDSLQPYSESFVQNVSASFFRGIVRTHHMHHDSGLLVYDFLRSERPGRGRRETTRPALSGQHQSGPQYRGEFVRAQHPDAASLTGSRRR